MSEENKNERFDYYCNRAQCYYDLQQYDLAEKDLQKGLEHARDKLRAQGLYKLGLTYYAN